MLEPSIPGLLTTLLQVDVVLWELNVLTSLVTRGVRVITYPQSPKDD